MKDMYFEDLDDDQALEEAIKFENKFTLHAKRFAEASKELCIPKIWIEEKDKMEITEYAPAVFRNIRKDIVSEQLLFDSFIPAANFTGIHNF